MKRLFLPFLLLIGSLTAMKSLAESRFLYLSAGGEIVVYQVALDSGQITKIQSNAGEGLTAVTSDQKTLYRIGGGEVESYRIEKDGKLRSLEKFPSSAKAGYIGVDSTERYLAGNNYREGSVAMWAIDDNGIAKGAPIAQLTLEKAAHSAVFSPGNGFLLVPATTPNKIFQIRFDVEKGALAPAPTPFVEGPSAENTAQQPRHLVFHPNGKIAYTTQERESPGVAVWKWDESAGMLTRIQDLISYPDGFEGTITTADLHLTPDAKFLYISNRDLTDRKAPTGASSIVGYRVNPDDFTLSEIGHTPVPQVPRAFAIDRAGEYLYSAGQVAAKLEAFRINKETGILTSIQLLDTGNGPNWIQCVTLP